MALVSEFSRCSLCDGQLDRPYMGLPDGARGMPAELWRYCDSVVHMDCFERWEPRKIFSEKCFEHVIDLWNHPSHGMGYILVQKTQWALKCGPIGPHTAGQRPEFAQLLRQMSGDHADRWEPFYTSVIMRDWTIDLRSKWFNWDEFVNEGYRTTWPLQGQALIDADITMTEVRKEVPNLETLYSLLEKQIK
jgi:hypothetical protein